MSDILKNRYFHRPEVDRRSFLKVAGVAGAAFALNTRFGNAANATPVKGGHLVMGLAGGASSDSLDPTLAAAQVARSIIKQLSDYLVMPASDGRGLEPALAESWEHSKDLKKWNFKLKPGVTFHNGKSMTSKDVVFSLNRHRGANSKSGAAGAMGIISDIKAEGDSEITIILSEANVDFPYVLTDYHVVIQPDGDPGNSGIGTGPYKLDQVNFGTRYITKKFKDYWNSEIGNVDSIETIVINDNTARVSALLNGQVHLINRVEPKVVALIKNAPSAKVVPTPGRGHYAFAMRCDAAPFDNADLRMALKLSIDREALVKQILQGYGSVANDTPVNETYPLAMPLPQRKYDPDKAAKLYKKSGHDGGIDLHVSDVAFAGAVDAATLFKEQAAKAGITINVVREPGDGYWSEVWNKKPFCATYWDGRPTQDQVLALTYRSGAPWNETAWKRPAFDELLTKARESSNDAERSELYKQANMMVRDDGGVIAPMFAQYLDGVSNKVKGYVPDVNNELVNGRVHERVWLEP